MFTAVVTVEGETYAATMMLPGSATREALLIARAREGWRGGHFRDAMLRASESCKGYYYACPHTENNRLAIACLSEIVSVSVAPA